MILVKKLKFFHLLYLSNIDGENVFADYLDKKEAFKDYKNKCLRITQNENSSKGVSPSFWSKILHFFQLSFLCKTDQEKLSGNVLVRKKFL